MSGTSDELFTAFRAVAPDILGRKKTRRLLEAMLAYLVVHTPENGVGPVIGRRREACQVLMTQMRFMEADREHV